MYVLKKKLRARWIMDVNSTVAALANMLSKV
jgi:hypothetical protein